jgi:cytochrome P450
MGGQDSAFDLYDRRFKTDPLPLFRDMLANGPFYATIDGTRSAVYARYRDIETIYADPALFSSEKPAIPSMEKVDYFNGDACIPFIDPPLHNQLRRTLNPAFMPASVAALETGVRAVVADILDRAEAKGGAVEVMADLARPLSMRVLLNELLQLTPEAQIIFTELSEAMFDPDRPAGSAKAKEFERRWNAGTAYCGTLIRRELDNPSKGVIASIIARNQASGRLEEGQILMLLLTLLTGGLSTIASLVGSAFLNLLKRPDQWALLAEDPARARGAVEEVARWQAPGVFNFRFPTRETEVGGLALEAGMPVYMMLGATSFDASAFEEPHRFDITRTPQRLLVFGHGIHHCIGAPVARMAVRELLRQTAERFPGTRLVDLDAAPVFTDATQEIQVVALPVRLSR